jgi:hypothetical protein
MKNIVRIAGIITIVLIVLIAALLILNPQDRVEANPNFPELTGPYLGQKPPGEYAERFAPDLMSAELHTAVVFSPDGREVYWKPMAEDEANEILFMKLEDEKWTHPQVVPFASRFFNSDDPSFLPDGTKLFFTSFRPVHWRQILDARETIWYVERAQNGWSRVKEVGAAINTMDLHWQLSISRNETIFFASGGDIYRSVLEDGEYQEPTKLSSAVNTASNEGHPYIAPDESYLIFSSNDPANSLGDYDLYVSLQESDGSWSAAMNLGERINSKYQDLYPVVSPDQKYLFFLSNREGMYSIYWVDFKPVKTLISE